ncbi:MAG TPA: hypothetical protein VHM88_15995 [Candidatus Acidoferrales bacterium]|nr:hypothetical protein [Candidatus Acidoferrales bacterium]
MFYKDKAKVREESLLFLFYGSAVHFVLHRLFLWSRLPKLDRAFPVHLPDSFLISIFGGLSVGWFMTRLLRRGAGVDPAPYWRIALKGGLYGIFATASAVVMFTLVQSVVLTVLSTRARTSSPLWVFVFILMGIGASTLEVTVGSAPFAFAYGVPAGLYIGWRRRRDRSLLALPVSARAMEREALVLSVLGFVFFILIPVGIVFSILAIVFGIRAKRRLPEAARSRKIEANVAVVLGFTSIAFVVFSLAIYFATRLGLI